MKPIEPDSWQIKIQERAVSVRMPEGSYRGRAMLYRRRTTRGTPSKRTNVEICFEMPVPFPNGWGDDAVYSISLPAVSIADAVKKTRASIMRDRLRRGGRGWRPTETQLRRLRRVANDR